jgi:hypothetical protein
MFIIDDVKSVLGTMIDHDVFVMFLRVALYMIM